MLHLWSSSEKTKAVIDMYHPNAEKCASGRQRSRGRALSFRFKTSKSKLSALRRSVLPRPKCSVNVQDIVFTRLCRTGRSLAAKFSQQAYGHLTPTKAAAYCKLHLALNSAAYKEQRNPAKGRRPGAYQTRLLPLAARSSRLVISGHIALELGRSIWSSPSCPDNDAYLKVNFISKNP
jgi:hypothetical protein